MACGPHNTLLTKTPDVRGDYEEGSKGSKKCMEGAVVVGGCTNPKFVCVCVCVLSCSFFFLFLVFFHPSLSSIHHDISVAHTKLGVKSNDPLFCL